MNKEVVKRLLQNISKVELKDLNTFITEYVSFELKKDVTVEELQAIVQLLQHGQFNLNYALLRAARSLNLNVLDTFNSAGQLLRRDVYETEIYT